MKTTRLLFVLAVLSLFVPGVSAARAADALKFYESEHGTSGNLSATITMTLAPGIVLSATTAFDVSLGGFQFHAVLGDATGYRPGKASATFVTRGGRSEPVTRVALQWRHGLLTVAVGASALGVADLADDFSEDATSMQAGMTFGNSSEQYVVTFRRVIARTSKISRGAGVSASVQAAGTVATVKFHVDVPTGKVTVTAPGAAAPASTGGISPLIAFQGTTVQFNSSTLLDQPGDTGVKVVNVSLTNRFGLPIGMMPDGTVTGLKVLFGGFNNVGAFTDPRLRAIVTTAAGSGSQGSQDGSVSTATFNGPHAVAVGNDGALYVTDFTNNKVREISGGRVTTLAGSGTAGSTDGSGKAATFNAPCGIAVNPVDGALIVTEFNGNKVRRITPDGVVTTVAGTGTAGGTNGAGSTAAFNVPSGVVVDSAGTIYIAEYTGNRIRKIVLTAGADPRLAASYTVSTLAGSGAAGSADGIGLAATFNGPLGLTILDGAIYMVDSTNNIIRRVSTTGEVVTIAGNGTASEVNGGGDVATFNGPRGIATVGEGLVVCDRTAATVRQLTLKVSTAAPSNPANWLVATLAGSSPTALPVNGRGDVATFNVPYFVATDGSRNVYVADVANNDVREITPALGYFPLGVATAGQAPSEGVQLSNADGVIPSSGAGINLPYINYPGELDFGATSAAQDWNFIVPSGVGAFEFTATVEADTIALEQPYAIGNVGPSGAGSANNDVRTIGGGATAGYSDGTGSQTRFDAYGVSADADGNVYVADANNSLIRRISNQGVVTTVAGQLFNYGSTDGTGDVATFQHPIGIAAAPDGRTLFVSEYQTDIVRRIALNPVAGTNPPVYDPANPANWSVSTIAGSATAGDSFSDGFGSQARFARPWGIALDASGGVYVTEELGNRIRRIQNVNSGNPALAQNWLVSTVAGDSSGAYGVSGANDGAGYYAQFNEPFAVASDPAGNLYVADSGNNRIRKITNPASLTNCTVSTLAGSSAGYADGPGTAAKFNEPVGIAADSAGYLWVSDQNNRRVRRISPSGAVETVAGTGSSSFIDGPGNLAAFATPAGLTIDPSGNLFLIDANSRVCIIQRVLTTGAP